MRIEDPRRLRMDTPEVMKGEVGDDFVGSGMWRTACENRVQLAGGGPLHCGDSGPERAGP